MKKNLTTISSIKENLEQYMGKDVKMEVCLGRKKMSNFDAVLTNIYPSVFTVNVPNSDNPNRSYSYTEILCGNVKIQPKNL